jgi:hypothetical protein
MGHPYSCEQVHLLAHMSCATSLVSGHRQANQFTRGSKRLGTLIPVSAERAIIFHLGLHSVREPKESLSMGFVDGLGDATTVR